MLNIGDKVVIQTDDVLDKKKQLMNGHICTISEVFDRSYLFPSMDPQYHLVYGLYWDPQDNPGRSLLILLNCYFWHEKDFAPPPSFIGVLESNGLPEL